MSAPERHRPGRLLGLEPVGGALFRVTLEPPAEWVTGYRVPGQFIEVRIAGATGFFVLASDPGATPWSLIMRAGGGASDVLLASAPGAALEVSAAAGDGFPLELAKGLPVVVALNGTGIAAAPPLLRRRLAGGDAARTRLFVGARSRADLPLPNELSGWAAAGIAVTACLSQGEPPRAGPSAAEPGRPGLVLASGYVQDALVTLPAGWLTGGYVFAVGSGAMIDALRAAMPALGLDPERVLTNY